MLSFSSSEKFYLNPFKDRFFLIATTQNFWAKASAKVIQRKLTTKSFQNFFQIFFNTNPSPNNRTPYLYIHARMNHKKGIYFVCME